MTKKNVGIFVVIYVALNLIVTYKVGALQRLKEIFVYERNHPEVPRKTVVELLDYILGG